MAHVQLLPELPDVGETVVFLGNGSYDPDGVIMVFYWEFGDGETGTGMIEHHLYTEPGAYSVVLTVVDDGGLVARVRLSVTVAPEMPSTSGSGCGCGK